MNKVYAGIGSRETPDDILEVMTEIAKKFSEIEWVLRSGGAIGADKAFEIGAGKKEIFYANDTTNKAMELSGKYHPAWDRCSDYAKKLHGRNAMILLGKDLNVPADLVVCWTSNGKERGGTGQGIRIANGHSIPVYNLYDQERTKKLFKLISNFEAQQ